MENAAARAALYIRVSSDRQAQQDLPIPAQRHELQQYCDRQGRGVSDVHVDDEAERERKEKLPGGPPDAGHQPQPGLAGPVGCMCWWGHAQGMQKSLPDVIVQ